MRSFATTTPTGECHEYSSPACRAIQFCNVCPPPAFAEKLNKLGPEHPTHIVTFDEAVVEAEDDGEVEEDERHKKNPDMWRNQNQKMKIMLHRLEKKHGFKATHIYSWASNGFAANLSQKQIEDIKTIRSAHIEENQAFSLASSPPWNNQTNNGQTVGWGIYATAANLSSALSGANTQIKDLSKTRIYILDTGVSPVHPELNVVKNLTATMDGSFNDCDGHGTAVAGIAAAKNNNSGVAGVAPGAPIISIKVFEGCTGPASTANVVRGIDSAMYEERVYFRNIPSYFLGAAVLNLSIEAPIGGLSLYNYNPFSTTQIAVKNSLQSATTPKTYTERYFWGNLTFSTKGIFSVLAAGNNGKGACEVWPAAFGKDITGAITVGAIDRLGARAIFNTTQSSNYGQCVEAWAPGLAIFSTILGGSTTGNVGSGTSFAAPFVAGIAALISDLYKNLSPRDMETLLKSNTIAAGYYTNPTDGIFLQLNVPQANKY